MYKEITLKQADGAEVPYKFLASGTTAYRYMQVFREDLMKKITSFEKDNDYTIADKLAYIMNAQAEGKDMKTLNYDSFLEWLDKIESSEIFSHMEELISLYIGTKFTNSIAKKSGLTDRPMTTALFILRAKQIGLTLTELDELEEGFVVDMIIESANDSETYNRVASQADFDKF